MGRVTRVSWLVRITWIALHFWLKASVEGSNVSLRFVEAPPVLSPSNEATFMFDVLVGERHNGCHNCSIKCKIDEQLFSNCEDRKASYLNLQDGNHKFEVCIKGSQGVDCESYSWTIDTIPPSAYITAERTFTNAANISVNISFSEPCTTRGRFGCSSVSACNLLVYGAGQVIPSSFTIIQPNLKFSLLVGLSTSVEYGRVVLVMDKGFCKDTAGNEFSRTTNSYFFVHFDRRKVDVSLRTHIPEKLVQLNSETRRVQATNNSRKLIVYLYFSNPVLNSSAEILSVLHASMGILLPGDGRSMGNRRFDYVLQNLSSIAIITINLDTRSIISRQGTPVTPTDPITFLYDSQRPSVSLSTTSAMRTRECTVPIIIKFIKPVFDFNASGISVTGGYLGSFQEVSRSMYTVEIHTDGDMISVNIPENITRDVSGNTNLPSNVLQVKHYSVPLISTLLSTLVTVTFAATSTLAGFFTLSTASLQSLGVLKRQSPKLTSEPTRNLFRIAYHIQVFALSKWVAAIMPVEYYEFVRGLQWSIPYLSLPWETGHVKSVMVNSGPQVTTHAGLSERHVAAASDISSEIDSSVFGLPLTPMEYNLFFESQAMKPEADFIMESRSSNGWREFYKNMLWLALFGSGLTTMHIFVLVVLKFRNKNTEKQKNYGALVLPRFEIFLILLALPCLCQASAAIVKGGSASGMVVGILLMAATSLLLLAWLLFISIGITLGKLLQYKEVHEEGQGIQWYQDMVRVALGPGKRGQWTWQNQANSVHLTMLGPLFEDLRGPPKYMLSQIAGGNTRKRGDQTQIIASDDETEDAEAPFIQKLFGILRIYYPLMESVKRVSLGIVASFSSDDDDASSKHATLVVLCITAFQLFFLVLKKPFIKKKVQLVEIISVTCELGIFAIFLVLQEMELTATGERRVGIFMLLLFMIGFTAQMLNEWYALYKQVLKLSPAQSSFFSGTKAVFFGILLILIPGKLLKKWDDKLPAGGSNEETREAVSSSELDSSSRSRSNSNSREKAWLRQLREMAKASFSKGDWSGSANDQASTSKKRSGLCSEKRSGSSSVTSSADFKAKPNSLYKDLEAIFSSSSR